MGEWNSSDETLGRKPDERWDIKFTILYSIGHTS